MLDNVYAISGAWLLFVVSLFAATMAVTVATNKNHGDDHSFFGWVIFVLGLLAAWSVATSQNVLPQGGAWWFLLIAVVVVTGTAALLKQRVRNDAMRFCVWLMFGLGVLLILYVMPTIKTDFIAWLSTF